MSTPRIFLEPGEEDGQRIALGGQRAHYLHRVVRIRLGERFVGVTTDGEEIEAVVTAVSGGVVQAEVVERRRPAREPLHHVVLALAVLKGKAMDWAVQKATEVGVGSLVPVLSSRVVVKAGDAEWRAKQQRWQEIARQAASFVWRTRVPQVELPLSVEALAERCQGGAWVLLDPQADARELGEAVRTASARATESDRLGIIVGPEGDFDEAEKALLRQAGAVPVSIGPRVLRAETAAVVGCALVLFVLGDMK